MSRIVRQHDSGRQRELLARSVVLALRALASRNEVDQEARDQAAYISLALQAIFESIEPTVAAWEKRGYWLKADRFRLEWAWSGEIAQQLKQALLQDEWGAVAALCARVSSHLDSITVPQRHRLGQPWVGAWAKLSAATHSKRN